MTTEHRYCGELISEDGLLPVAKALTHCSWRIVPEHADYNGGLYLRTPAAQREIDLAMDSGQWRRFLFSGGVDSTKERALSLLADFSRCLTAGNFTHRVEVYDEANELVGYFHHKWPQGQHEPAA